MTTKLGYNCGAMRQQDEWYCPLCHTRWEHNGHEKPPCAPVIEPVHVNMNMPTTKTRFNLSKKRARKFRSFR